MSSANGKLKIIFYGHNLSFILISGMNKTSLKNNCNITGDLGKLHHISQGIFVSHRIKEKK